MLVMGLSGANEREHDPSCCIIKDGKLIAMVEEERFVREKHAPGIPPHNSIKYCLNTAGCTLDDVDFVCLGWDYKSNPFWEKEHTVDKLEEMFFPKEMFPHLKKPNFKFYEHHLAHAASSFLFSGLDESLILVMDGQGETESTSLGYGFTYQGRRNISFLKKYPIQLSLGYMYDKVAEYIGLGHWSAGKLMGLSSYGKEPINLPVIYGNNGLYDFDFNKSFIQNKDELDDEDQMKLLWFELLKKIVGDVKKSPVKIGSKNANLALGAQVALENISLFLVEYLKKYYPDTNNLCISGGVGLNCANNAMLKNRFKFEKIFVQPAANDAGIALGAAAICSEENGGPVKALNNTYYGPDFSEEEIKASLIKRNIQFKKIETGKMEKYIAQQLYNQKVVGWLQGRMEFGPRSLGNRSILACPAEQKMHDRLNKIKGRENWRPFAPIVLEKDSSKYFNITDSPYMLFFTNVNGKYQSLIPAVTHVDGTTRPQTVNKKNNKVLYDLLNEYKKISGNSILLNTSFNIAGEPIVCTPEDALKTFIKSNLDILVMNNYVIEK